MELKPALNSFIVSSAYKLFIRNTRRVLAFAPSGMVAFSLNEFLPVWRLIAIIEYSDAFSSQVGINAIRAEGR